MDITHLNDLISVRLNSGQPGPDVLLITAAAAAEQPAPGKPGSLAGDLFLHTNTNGTTELVVSTGKKVNEEAYRQAGGAVARWIFKYKPGKAALDPEGFSESVYREAFVEGLLLGSYQYTTRKEKNEQSSPVQLWTGLSDEVNQRLSIIAQAVALTRELGHEPANFIHPVSLAEIARSLADRVGLQCTILDDEALRTMGAGAITAVGQGSQTGSRLIILEYPGKSTTSQQPVALVGKAITFDTGGYSLKSVENIRSMKYDKMGGLTVLATMTAAAQLDFRTPLVGLICAAENMISAEAFRPDDIITSLSGKTIEILTTDAEGRLVLADGLTYAQRHFNPSEIIDLATLTGGVVTALGSIRAGVMSNNDALTDRLFQAGEAVHERLWRLPLDDDYRDFIVGDEGDLKNSGGKEAHPIMGGIFLKQFVENDTPWAHIDIAGTASTSKDLPYSSKGATGFGVRLLLRYLENL